jgi:plastocyanin
MRRICVVIAALSISVLWAASANAAEITTGPGATYAGFSPPAVVVAPGETLTYTNFDVDGAHNIVASDAFHSKKAARKLKWCSNFEKGRCPLFWSRTVYAWELPNNSAVVRGLKFVKSGTQYGFVCWWHPGMKGTLLVR